MNSRRLGASLFLALLAFIFLHAASGKFLAAEVPPWFVEQFAPTPIGRMPWLLTTSYWGIASLELIAGVAAFLAIFRQRFRAYAFLSAEMTFAALGVGLRMSGRFPDAAALFAYFSLTLLVHLATSREEGPGRERE